MSFFQATKAKLCFAILALTLFFNSVNAQTTLSAGDVAFTGYVSADGCQP
jgi:hypothetical protein